MTNFDFDPADALSDDDFLTPVYFGREVLVKYLYDPRLRCDFASETYGQIFGEGFSMAFGINPNGHVVAWLGDLRDLPAKEQLCWLAANRPSDHNPKSEFFDAQIKAEFTPPPAAVRCLNAIAQLNAAFHLRFGAHLYHERPLEARLDEVRRYRRLVIGNRDDFKRFLSELNGIVNESVDNAAVRRLLEQKQIAVATGSKGNKLLEAVYTRILGDTENLIAPFFYLYDLRLWADHADALDAARREEIFRLLGVTDPDDYQTVFANLVASLADSAVAILAKIEAA